LQRYIPSLQPKGQPLLTIPGQPPNLAQPIPGCAFRERCQTKTRDQCLVDRQPELIQVAPGHWVQNCPGCLGAME
jgi:oligopeptide/dipeptide ABC transporter ATP-binding protein